ncbi:MAG: TonB-dependent receptor [Pseudomonadota bacterium]
MASGRFWVFCSVLGAFALGAAVGHAQSDGDAEQMPDEGEVVIMDTITVEGEKIERGFVETHSSVGIITEDEIDDLKIEDLKDSFRFLGNVRVFEGNRGNNGFVIRGINSEGVTQPTNNAPVTSVIIDGATQSVESTRRGARGIWDVGQIEVFRGPQSTLQGRGALAGAVIVNTKNPTFFWEYGGQARIGQDERLEGAFVVSGPLLEDQVAFRLSGEARRRNFDITFDEPANEVLAEDRFRNLRGKLLIEPGSVPELSLLLTASATFDRPGVNAVNSADFFDREFNTGPTTAVELREATNFNYIADLTWTFSEALALRSITSFIDSELKISTPEGFDFQRRESRAGKDVTQDLRLTFDDAESTFSGVAGFFFGNFTLPRDSLVTVGGGQFVVQDLTSDDKTRNFSIYGDARWEFVEDFTLLAGARYTYETVENVSNGFFLGAADIDASEDFSVFLPKIGLAYAITDTQSIAFTAQRGYRSGFTELDSSGEENVVDPEFLWNFELAYRAASADGNWNIGATAFYYRYTDQQIPVTNFVDDGNGILVPLTETLNAGRSRSFGAEIEGRYNFDFGLSLFGSLGLLNTEFQSLPTAAGDFTGNEFPEAPTVTASFGGTYTHDSGAFVSADVVYTSDYFSTGSLSNDPQLEVDGFVEVGLRLGYEEENWKVTAFAENLFNRDIITSLSNNDTFGAEPVEATVADGFLFGVEVEVAF